MALNLYVLSLDSKLCSPSMPLQLPNSLSLALLTHLLSLLSLKFHTLTEPKKHAQGAPTRHQNGEPKQVEQGRGSSATG